MTKNKRFIIMSSNFIEDGFFIKDTMGKFSFGTTRDKSSLVMYEKQLNELSTDCRQLKEENEQLKQRIKELKETIIKITHSYHQKHDNTIVNLIGEVYEEDIGDLFIELNRGDVE